MLSLLYYCILVAFCIINAEEQHRSMPQNDYNVHQVCCTGTNGYYRSLIATGLMNADMLVTGSTDGSSMPNWPITDLTVRGSAQLSEGCISGSWCIGQDLTVAETTLLAGGATMRDLCVAGDSCTATIVTSTLTVTGTVTFQTTLSLTVTTSAEYIFPTSLVSDLLISGSLTVPGMTNIQSSLTIDGDYTIRGSTCTDTAFSRNHMYAQNLVASSGTSNTYSNMLDYSLIRLRKAAFQTVGNEYLLPGSGSNAQFGSAVAISGRGDIVAIASPTYTTVSIYQRAYTVSGSQWILIQTIATGSPPSSVALSADAQIMAIGYETANASSGVVELYRYNEMTSAWDLLQTIAGLESGELFGHGVSLSSSGSILLVGAPQGNGGTGRAYLLYKQVTTCPNLTTESWALRFALVAQSPQVNAKFGSSVGISADGRYGIIGEPNRTDTLPGQGAAYLYALVGIDWMLQQGPIVSPIPTNNGQFAQSVAIANNGLYLVIGDSARTTAVIYGKTAYNDWIANYDLTPPDGLGTTGDAVSISFDGTVAIASDTSDSAIPGGRVLVAERFTNRWQLRYVLSPVALASGDTFGATTMVAADGAFVIAGAPGASGGIGNAYVYSPLCTDMPTDLAITGTLCVAKNVTIDGNLVVQKSISYGGTQNPGVSVLPCGICSSDMRLKHTIEELKGSEAIQLLKKLRPVTFYWKHPQVHPELGEHPISCIAQEVDTIMPHWVERYESEGPDRLCTEDGTLLALAYKPDVYAYLVASLHYLSERLAYLEGLYQQRAHKGNSHDQ